MVLARAVAAVRTSRYPWLPTRVRRKTMFALAAHIDQAREFQFADVVAYRGRGFADPGGQGGDVEILVGE